MINKKKAFGVILGFLMMNVGDFMINMKENEIYEKNGFRIKKPTMYEMIRE